MARLKKKKKKKKKNPEAKEMADSSRLDPSPSTNPKQINKQRKTKLLLGYVLTALLSLLASCQSELLFQFRKRSNST